MVGEGEGRRRRSRGGVGEREVRGGGFLGCTSAARRRATRACRRCNRISSGTTGCVTRCFFIPAAGAACVF